jgi:hypothetical protein
MADTISISSIDLFPGIASIRLGIKLADEGSTLMTLNLTLDLVGALQAGRIALALAYCG